MTAFLRSVLIADGMRVMKELQKTCPAYLGLGEKIEELTVLGSVDDQRVTMVSAARGDHE